MFKSRAVNEVIHKKFVLWFEGKHNNSILLGLDHFIINFRDLF
jgi:hypothetical protein